MPSDPTNPRHPSQWTAADQAVAELLARVVAQRGLDFEPEPAPVIDALPGLTQAVEEVAVNCLDEQERRWPAAALAALSHHVQVSTLGVGVPLVMRGPSGLRAARVGRVDQLNVSLNNRLKLRNRYLLVSAVIPSTGW